MLCPALEVGVPRPGSPTSQLFAALAPVDWHTRSVPSGASVVVSLWLGPSFSQNTVAALISQFTPGAVETKKARWVTFATGTIVNRVVDDRAQPMIAPPAVSLSPAEKKLQAQPPLRGRMQRVPCDAQTRGVARRR